MRRGEAGEDEDWDLYLTTGVPALISSINRSCFFASIRKRWLPTSSLSGERLIHRMFGFCETVRSVSFQTAGSWARTVLRFGATDRAEANDEVVASGANLNLMFTHS